MIAQLAFDFEAPPAPRAPMDLSFYDREPIGDGLPLTAAEIAILEHHGYTLLARDGDAYQFAADDGRAIWERADYWRGDIDILFLYAKHVRGLHDPRRSSPDE